METDQQDKQIAQLEAQLQEYLNAENFFETGSGKLWVQLATAEINKILKDITSDNYRKDLNGYNIALSDLRAYRTILNRMKAAGAKGRGNKIQERLDQHQNG